MCSRIPTPTMGEILMEELMGTYDFQSPCCLAVSYSCFSIAGNCRNSSEGTFCAISCFSGNKPVYL